MSTYKNSFELNQAFMPPPINYIMTIRSFNGTAYKVRTFETEDQVHKAIAVVAFGDNCSVDSPTGKDLKVFEISLDWQNRVRQ